jgi:hypothetical protein
MSSRYELSQTVQRRLKEENLTADEVLRKALGMKNEGFSTSDGTYFPEGSVFLTWYKDRACSAVVKDGAIDIDGKTFTSLSAAAAHYTGRPTTNGWSFWSVKIPGKQEFVLCSTLGPRSSKAVA